MCGSGLVSSSENVAIWMSAAVDPCLSDILETIFTEAAELVSASQLVASLDAKCEAEIATLELRSRRRELLAEIAAEDEANAAAEGDGLIDFKSKC